MFGLTHGYELLDVTTRSTCHTSDETVAHFPRDSCSAGLTFSGGELGGSDGLSLVAKVDRTSAGEAVTVWFPQQPHGVSLVVESPKGGSNPTSSDITSLMGSREYSTTSTLLRAITE